MANNKQLILYKLTFQNVEIQQENVQFPANFLHMKLPWPVSFILCLQRFQFADQYLAIAIPWLTKGIYWYSIFNSALSAVKLGSWRTFCEPIWK